MKKLVAMIMVLVMLLAVAAFAEDEEFAPMPEEATGYEGKWICDRASMEVVWEEEGFRVFIQWGSSASESTEWSYSCFYNAKNNSMESMPTGTRTEIVYNDSGEIESFNEAYNDGEATFALDEEGYLIWHDEKEDAGKDMRFEKVDLYSGAWICGRASMEIALEDSGYKVFISWPSGAAEVSEWEYSCVYSFVSDALEAMPFGIRTDLIYGEDGEIASSNVIYEDGEATFSLDENGYLLWQDAKEDAGKDMRFERVEILYAENNGV